MNPQYTFHASTNPFDDSAAVEGPLDHQNPQSVPSTDVTLLDRYVLDETQTSNVGAAGLVGTSKKYGSQVLIRRVPKQDSQRAVDARREIAALSAVSDPCIPGLAEWVESDSAIWLVIDHKPGHPIGLMVGTHGAMPEDMIKPIVTQLFAGLASLFLAGFAHLRICDQTLYLDSDLQLMIKDFQFATVYGHDKIDDLYAETEEKFGSDIYVAPEVFATRSYNARKAVIWSTGVALYFMATGQTEKLSNLGHPSFESANSVTPLPDPDDLTEAQSHRRKLSVASSSAIKIVTYPNRLAVATYLRDIISKMLATDPLRRAELIEVAAKVPKELAVKETRPLIELAWLDYKTHVGPLAGMGKPAGLRSSASSLFSAVSDISNPFSGLLNGRRRSSLIKGGAQTTTTAYAPRRQTIATPQTATQYALGGSSQLDTERAGGSRKRFSFR